MLPCWMRPGRMRRSSSCVVIAGAAAQSEAMALGILKSLRNWRDAPARRLPQWSKSPTPPTTCARPRSALLSCRSVGWVPGLPPCDPQTCAKALHSMMACKRGHGCDVRCDMGTNSPFERGERCVESAVVVTGDGWSIGALEDGCDGCALLSGRMGNSGASVHARRHSGDRHRVIERADADRRTDIGDVGARLRRKRPAGRQMILIARWTGIVGGQKSGCTIAVVQLAQICSTGQDVVVRIIGIGAETVADTQMRPRFPA